MKLSKSLGLFVSLAISQASFAYHTEQGKIYDESQQEVQINGLSWSGFQDTNIFQGLQSNPFYSITSLSYAPREYGMMDAITHPWDFQSIGVEALEIAHYKTLRLPIQPGVLFDNKNQVDLNKSLSNKNFPQQGNGIFCQVWQQNGNSCEQAVSPQKAFWIVLEEMKRQNMRVLLDMHHRYGYGDAMRDGTVYDIQQYASDIALLAKETKTRALDNVIGIDIFNEPYRLNWFKEKNAQVPWVKVIATAANAIYQNNPELLVFVEGPGGGNDDADNPVICVEKTEIQDDPLGYSHSPDNGVCGSLERVFFKGNWGEDFKPLLNQDFAKQGKPVFDREKLSRELLNQGIKPAALSWLLGDNQAHNAHLVFSPHVYPKEVAGWETAPGKPSNLRFDWSWGFLYKAGFPIVLGEASWKSEEGKKFFTQSLMPYLKSSRIGQSHVFFWAIGYLGDTVSAINPNSGALNKDVSYTLKPFYK